MEDRTFGAIIAEKRKEMGMTQAELAERMGVTDKAVSKWERDLSYPDIASLPRLAGIFGLSLDELMRNTASGNADKKKENVRDIISVALRGIALAMGIAVLVLSIIDELDSGSGIGMLGLGLASLAIFLLRNEKK